MGKGDAIHYFVDANSSAGYVDLWEQSFGGLSHVAEPVSYTHLDVYKRQVQIMRPLRRRPKLWRPCARKA